MKIVHNEVRCNCKKKNTVLIELTEDEAAHLADHFDDNDTVNTGSWPSNRKLAKDIQDLAGQW